MAQGQFTAADLQQPPQMWASHVTSQQGQFTMADVDSEQPGLLSRVSSYVGKELHDFATTPPGETISGERAAREFTDYMNRGAGSIGLALGMSGFRKEPNL